MSGSPSGRPQRADRNSQTSVAPQPPAATGGAPAAVPAAGARLFGGKPTYRRIGIALIDVPADRLSSLRSARIETIGKTAKAVGLMQAINVEALDNGRYLLIAGAKRLAALDLAGETEIDARVHPAGSLSADGRRLMEIVENIDRQDLTKLERAEYLAALKDVHERLYPATRNGGDRRSAEARAARADQTEIFAFSSQAAEMTGLSRRAIEVAVQIVIRLTAASKARLRDTWLEDHQAGLKLLSEQTAEMQERVCDLVFAVPPQAATVADAVAIAEGRRLLSTAEKMFASTLGNWARFSERQRADFLDAQEAAIRAHAKRRGWF
jgi:ParB family chromosome partitioning protein